MEIEFVEEKDQIINQDRLRSGISKIPSSIFTYYNPEEYFGKLDNTYGYYSDSCNTIEKSQVQLELPF